MKEPINILLQTTIPFREDDWHIGRFSLLAEHLRSLKGSDGNTLYNVIARDRENDGDGNDAVLSVLDSTDFDQVWLFAVDTGDGLTTYDCAGITRFRQRGGGILSARDHQDLGSSLCTLGGIGAAHYFHSKQCDPDELRNCRDDQDTINIDYPNYHSGSNGDFQRINALDHPLMKRLDGTLIEYFPAHPHEGGIGVPNDSSKVVATGKSKATGSNFNLVVAFENSSDSHGNKCGRAIAESSFHHMVDYNWDIEKGSPSFVEEQPGDEYKSEPGKLDDIKQYVANAAKWLSNI
jgi:hypothetical protein